MGIFDFLKRSRTLPATMPSRRERVSLTMIDVSASHATPTKLRKDRNGIRQRMINRHVQPIGIHHVHEASKFPSVGRTAFLHVKLPLMNHFMGQDIANVEKRVLTKERDRQPNDSTVAMPYFRKHASMAWTDLTDKQPRGRRQTSTPLNLNGRQSILEIRHVQPLPEHVKGFCRKRNAEMSRMTRHQPHNRPLIEDERGGWYHVSRLSAYDAQAGPNHNLVPA